MVLRINLTFFQDIRGLLSDWVDEIDQCERIWIRASASNRRIFLDYDGAVIAKGESSSSESRRLFTSKFRRRKVADVPFSHSQAGTLKKQHLRCLLIPRADTVGARTLPL